MAKKRIPKKVEEKVKEFVKILKTDNLPISRVFVFGSYAKGTQNKWSDVDVCVISPKFKDPWNAMDYLWAKRIFDPKITLEPIGFNPKDFKENTPLTREIKKDGVAIKT